uniref:Granulins domain-containing protein n=1 Tax=Sinocyclocheilus grahami TaxID=75366 RepID=A0A672L5X6_SINGR
MLHFFKSVPTKKQTPLHLGWLEVDTVKNKAVICPDQESECPDDTTCCQMPDGSWGCCPMKDAVCCEDHIHCCPEDTVCDLAASTCDDPADLSVSVPWMAKVPTFPIASSNQKCDETSSCPDGSTCCRLSSGKWGCCPLPQGLNLQQYNKSMLALLMA